jgi:hypothetical protein
VITINDLITPLTVDEVKTSIYTMLNTLGVTTTNWRPGAVVRTIITIVATLIAALSQFTAAIARANYLDLAVGDWLTLLARYVYGVERIEATFATGVVRLDNASGGVYNLSIGDLIVKNPITGKQYVNTEAVVVGALATNVLVDIQASEIGEASTSFADEITVMVTTFTGVTCTNPASVVGFEAEEDEALRIRCRAKLGSLSPNGPSDAYDYVARTAVRADGSAIGVTRVSPTYPDGYGGLTVYVADATGSLTGTAGDPSTDLGAVNEAIQTKVVPLPVLATVESAAAQAISVSYEVWLYNIAGLSETAITDAISAALSEFISARPIGGDIADIAPGYVYRSGLEAAIGGAKSATGVPLGIFRAVISNPAADVPILLNGAPVAGIIAATAIHQVAP